MPTADRPRFVPVAIASFLAQDFTDSELLVLDDGAAPILALLPEAELISGRIRYVFLSGKRKTGEKRNLCAELAAGEIIVHWDDDDWSAPTRVRDQVDRLARSGKAVTGYNSLLFFDERDGKVYQFTSQPEYTVGTSQCYLKSWWAKHAFPAVQLGEDSTFGHEAAKLQQVAVTDGSAQIVAVVHAQNSSLKPLNSSIYRPVAPQLLPAGFREAYADLHSLPASAGR